MTNIIPFPEKKKKHTSKSKVPTLEFSKGVPEFTIDQDVTDEYLASWANWLFLQDLAGPNSIKQDLFATKCMQLEELGLELMDTDPTKFRQLEKEINELIIKNTP